MSLAAVISPYQPINGLTGLGLNNGFLYIGADGQDPEVSPQTCYWDPAGSVVAAQPISIVGGYPMRLGTPTRLYTQSSYSIRARDRTGAQVFYEAHAVPAPNVSAGTFQNVAAVLAGFIPTNLQPGGLNVLGYFTPGDLGQAFYTYSTVQSAGAGRIQSADGAWWEVQVAEPSPFHFGAKGDGSISDVPAWDACQAYARAKSRASVYLAGKWLYGTDTFYLQPGVRLVSGGGGFRAIAPFSGAAVFATPNATLYINGGADVLRVDVNDLRTAGGAGIKGVVFDWVKYSFFEQIYVDKSTSTGLQVNAGSYGSPLGNTGDFRAGFVECRASQVANGGVAVDANAYGVYIDGSDHEIRGGMAVGYPVGGATPCANSRLGKWHVWSTYHTGWSQMRVGWDWSGEGNQGFVEVDSPGAINPANPTTWLNGPLGVVVHQNAIRSKLAVMINISNFGDAGVFPAPGSVLPVVVANSYNEIDLDIVDYYQRQTGTSLVAAKWILFSQASVAQATRVTGTNVGLGVPMALAYSESVTPVLQIAGSPVAVERAYCERRISGGRVRLTAHIEFSLATYATGPITLQGAAPFPLLFDDPNVKAAGTAQTLNLAATAQVCAAFIQRDGPSDTNTTINVVYANPTVRTGGAPAGQYGFALDGSQISAATFRSELSIALDYPFATYNVGSVTSYLP